jgi:hypothetical protein
MCENSVAKARVPMALTIDIREFPGAVVVDVDVDHDLARRAGSIDSLKVDEVFRAAFDGDRYSVAVEITVLPSGEAQYFVDELEELEAEEDECDWDDIKAERDLEDTRFDIFDRLRVLFTGRL